MVLILAIVWAPRWFHTYGIFFLRRSQYVGCTQYMATRTAILDGKIVLNQCLEEIAKREAPSSLPAVPVTMHQPRLRGDERRRPHRRPHSGARFNPRVARH